MLITILFETLYLQVAQTYGPLSFLKSITLIEDFIKDQLFLILKTLHC